VSCKIFRIYEIDAITETGLFVNYKLTIYCGNNILIANRGSCLIFLCLMFCSVFLVNTNIKIFLQLRVCSYFCK